MKIALVHDQLQEFGGAERVLVSLKNIFLSADIYTSFYSPKALGVHKQKFKDWKIITSWADKIPFLKKLYSPLRSITPLIWEPFDFSDYDIVVSSSGSYMSKGVITKPGTVHICYIHHPPRYLYYYATAIEWQKYILFKIYGNIINHSLRLWDYLSSQRPDYFIANSQETKRRVEKLYRRKAVVIYPPVSIVKKIKITSKNRGYYLTVSRLARTKHIDILIRASNKLGFRLKIVGKGRDMKNLQKIAGKNVQFLGSISDKRLRKIYENAKGFLFASKDEEFGIAPIEAMGYGLPVIALKSGGVPEYLKEGKNGFLFDQLNENGLIKKIKKLESLSENKYFQMKKNARKASLNFSQQKFKEKILAFVNKVKPLSGEPRFFQ